MTGPSWGGLFGNLKKVEFQKIFDFINSSHIQNCRELNLATFDSW